MVFIVQRLVEGFEFVEFFYVFSGLNTSREKMANEACNLHLGTIRKKRFNS